MATCFSLAALGVNVIVVGAHILVVDDDDALLSVLQLALEDSGFLVDTAQDGREGFARFQEGRFDLVILDVLMPEMDGLSLLKAIRRAGAVPVVMLTSRDEDVDQIVALEMGADDYVTKPFKTRVLIARIEALLRRMLPQKPASLSIRGLEMDREKREIILDGQPVVLTATEFDLLFVLASTPGRAHSRDDLIDAVYGVDILVSHRTIDTFIKRLRRKLREVEPTFDEIDTVRAIGYRYQA